MTFSLKTYLITIAVLLMMLSVSSGFAWRAGWYAHSSYINGLADKKRVKAEATIKPVEQKAAQAKDDGKVIYKTITRDVVKYVQDPKRTVCKFDDTAVRLRQRAIDAANNIAGFDDATLQGK